MADFPASGKIFPSNNDVNGGMQLSETNISLISSVLASQNFTYSGAQPSLPGGLVIRIAPGVHLIDGKYVETPQVDVSIGADFSGAIWLILTKDGYGYVTGSVLRTYAGAVPSEDQAIGVPIWSGGSNSSDITASSDKRKLSRLSQANVITLFTYPTTSGLTVGTSELFVYASTITWSSDLVPPGRNLYFEFEGYGSSTTLTVKLNSRDGSLNYSTLTTSSSTVNVVRSAPISPLPDDGTNIAVAAKQAAGGTAGLMAARLVIQ